MAAANFAWPGNMWAARIWQDLQPTPGRVSATLRITLASVLTLLVLMTLQMPFASLGLYFVFLVGRDSPAVSIRSGVLFLLTLLTAAALELAVVILTDNDPMARVISVAVVSFLAGILMVASSLSPLASVCGFIFCTLIATWENHVPSNALVEGSLWLVATAGVAVVCSVAVEYIFGTQHPAEKLQEQRHMRYRALEKMFNLYAAGVTAGELSEAALGVARLAVNGQAGMQELYNKIVERNLDVGELPVGTRVRITMLAQLMDLAAAFATQYPAGVAPALQQRCAHIAGHCHELRLRITSSVNEEPDAHDPGVASTLLERVEANLRTILSMPSNGSGSAAERNKEMVALPSRKAPFLVPGAIKHKETVAFALKISLCVTLCYILYHAVDWPGISTSVTTVLITGLSSSGAIKQKLIFRIAGAIIGGLILGLGATAFLFPYMDSITSLVVLVTVIASISAWCAAGRRFNYVGLQIAFSFYLVAFEGFSAPTELAPARDRLIGILLALVVMAFVFDQLWPVRTVTTMRQSLASILRAEAALFRLVETGKQHAELLRRADDLRDYIGKAVAGLRTMSEAVEYEFGVDRQAHARSSEMIIQAALSAASLFWNEIAYLNQEQAQDFINDPALIEMRRKLAAHMEALAGSVVQKAVLPLALPAAFIDPARLNDLRYGDYVRTSVARYQELQSTLAGLSQQA